MENFHIILQSKQTPHLFPDNNGTDFTVQLGKSLKFPPKSYEVGVAEFYYTQTAPPKDKNGNYIRKEQKFFGNVVDDDIIHVKKHTQSGFSMNKTKEDLLGFAQDLEKELNDRSYRVTIELAMRKGRQLFYIKFDGDKSLSVAFPQELSNAFGFDKTTFDYGDHYSDRESSQTLFDAIPADTEFVISLFDRRSFRVKVEEPGEYSINSLLAAINTALKDYKLIFKFEVSQLEFTSVTSGSMAMLSRQISDYLGIAQDLWFHEMDMKVPANPYLVLYIPAEFMLITCSCAEDQMFGDKLVPVLRVLPIPSTYSKQMAYTFSPIQYVGLSGGSELTKIRIHILDDQLRPLPVSSEPSTVVLHFRPRSL